MSSKAEAKLVQILEALNSPAYGKELRELQDKAIATCQQALAQPAPVSNETMQKLREKLESPSYNHALAYQNIREALEIVMRWIDDYCETGPENDFERVEKIANAAMEYTPPAAPVQEPLFWYRPCRDGMYEGPVHNNSVGGKMLRDEKPDEWKPLYTTPPAAPKKGQP